MELNTDLYCAVQEGDLSKVESLLDSGASVNTTSYHNKWSPLHLAVVMNRSDVIELLIKREASMNLADTDGETALHIAFSQDYIHTAELLIKHGSSLEQRDRKGRKPFQAAPNERRKGVNLQNIFDEEKRKCIVIEKEIPVEDALDGNKSFYRKNIIYIRQSNSELKERKYQDIRKSIVVSESKPSKETLIENKRERRLVVFEDLKIGLEVAFGRLKIPGSNRYMYKHHGIIIDIPEHSTKFEIVELTATNSYGNISAAVLSKNIKPKIEKKMIQFKDNLFYYDYTDKAFSGEVTKDRAEILYYEFDRSDVEYNLSKFNCEHFACYCATGLAFSGQTSYVNKNATDSLDEILESYITHQSNGGPLENIPDESRDRRYCSVM